MARNDNKPAAAETDKTASAEMKDAGTPAAKPTTVRDAEGNDVAPPSTLTGAAAPGSRENLDPESDAGKAAAVDAAHSGGAIRAEDNAGDGRQPDGAAEASASGSDPSVGEKINVKCSGPFVLQDPYSLDTITDEGGPEGGVTRTSFIDDRLASGQLVEA